MSKIVFTLGGNRSGKSDFTQKYAESLEGVKTYIATAIPFDQEMKKRIEMHRVKRGKKWDKLIEEPYKLPFVVSDLIGKSDIVLIDCITIWLSNLLLKDENNISLIYQKIDELILNISNINYNLFIVSNEVGMGIVPENRLARIFRDISGVANQKLAEISDEFYIAFAGFPLRLK